MGEGPCRANFVASVGPPPSPEQSLARHYLGPPPSPEQSLARHYPGPAGAWRPRGLARRHSNFACNSPAACSNIEFASLELQRFLGLLKFGPIELHAKFVWLWSCDRPPAPWRVPAARGPPVPSGPSAPSGPFRPPGPTSALRTSGAWCAVVACRDSASRSVQNSPCLVFC